MRFLIRTGMLPLLLLLASCKDNTPEDRFDRGTINVSCDESFRPVLDAEIDVYRASFPNAEFKVQYKPEADCLRDFAVDSIRLIIATRGYSSRERQYMIDSAKVAPEMGTVAYDAIAVIVHPSNADSFFTMDQVRGIVSGKLKKNLIPVFDGVKATSTVRFMLDSVLRGESLGAHVVAAQSSEGVVDYVSKTPNAIGFLGVSWVGNREDTMQLGFLNKVRIARIESTDSAGYFVPPVQYLIYTRSYPMVRDLVYVLKEQHLGLGKAFVNFLKGERGQLVFRRAYLQPSRRPYYVRRAELTERSDD
jgi:phosphate transport system substrate-binding protein